MLAPPITYAVDGEQYVALVVGWGAVYANLWGVVMNSDGQQQNISRILAFKIGGEAELPAIPTLTTTWEPPDDFGSAEQVAEGASSYGKYCTICHGIGAVGGGVIPDVRRSAMITSTESFNSVVLDGVLEARGMASFAEALTPDEVESIRAFIVAQANVAAGTR